MNFYINYSRKQNIISTIALVFPILLILPSCKKLVTIGEPENTITTEKVFSTDAQANSAMAGVYTQMINGNATFNDAYSSFSNGLVTILAGLSSDELIYYTNAIPQYYLYNINRLIAEDQPSAILWSTAYNIIYGSNAVIEGIAASSSPLLHDSVRNRLTGEAEFTRAFSYFYLVNLFGDVPLALTIDFNKTSAMPRTPKEQVYKQIVEDLKDAEARLAADYTVSGGERIRPNKWAAAALLARVYLYMGEYNNAVLQAKDVIDQHSLYELETDLHHVFMSDSKESIWQLQQNNAVPNLGNATPEGAAFIPNPFSTGLATFYLTEELKNAFEYNDRRKQSWIDSTDYYFQGRGGRFYFPYKYTTGLHNYVPGGPVTEYYMIMRLAELYLIHAEAALLGGQGGIPTAIADLNIIRHRAGLNNLPITLSHEEVLDAIAHERRVEFFAEWGHRWLDLKRTGKAQEILSAIVLKQPWQGDFQLLYPIPVEEIRTNTRLIQNPSY